jgi:hypothetical protein
VAFLPALRLIRFDRIRDAGAGAGAGAERVRIWPQSAILIRAKQRAERLARTDLAFFAHGP